jgi:hypothetical protein
VSETLGLHLANDLAAMAGLAEAVDRFGAAHRLPGDIQWASRITRAVALREASLRDAPQRDGESA